MPSAEQLAFWAAIRANPLDDTPRLVYADWLQENGDLDRAEFIRIQCELNTFGTDRRQERKRRAILEPQEEALLAEHKDAWLAPFRTRLKGSQRFDREDRWLEKLTFSRGFPELGRLELETARRLAEAGDELEPVGPCTVLEAKVAYRHEAVIALAGWAGAGCLTDFTISGADDPDVLAIVGSKSLRNLSRLGLWFGVVTDEGVSELLRWPHVGGLRWLDLKENPITDVGAFQLADSPDLANLNRLELTRTRISRDGRKRLRERWGDKLRIESEPD